MFVRLSIIISNYTKATQVITYVKCAKYIFIGKVPFVTNYVLVILK